MDTVPIAVSAAVACAATLSAGIFLNKFQKHIGIFCGFSAGVVIAIAFFDMIPEVLSLAPVAEVSLEMPLITAIGGFFLLFGLSKGSHIFRKRQNQHTDSSARFTGAIATAEFCFHGFLEGLAIGLGFQFGFGLGAAIAVA